MSRRAAPGVAPRLTADGFLHDDARRNKPNRAAPQGFVAGDRDWFARHIGRNYRLRPPTGNETALCAPSPHSGRFHGWRAVFVVRRTPSGDIIRLPVPWPPGTPLLGEGRAKAVFDWSAGMFARAGQSPADVEARLRRAIQRAAGGSP